MLTCLARKVGVVCLELLRFAVIGVIFHDARTREFEVSHILVEIFVQIGHIVKGLDVLFHKSFGHRVDRDKPLSLIPILLCRHNFVIVRHLLAFLSIFYYLGQIYPFEGKLLTNVDLERLNVVDCYLQFLRSFIIFALADIQMSLAVQS